MADEIVITASEIKSGMKVARDVYTKNEQLLFPTGTIIDDTCMARIAFYGIISIAIVLDEEGQALLDEPSDSQKPQESVVTKQNKEELQKFNEQHHESALFVEHTMNQLIEADEDIDEVKLVNEVESVIGKTSSGYQVFDMLNYIQNFDDETYVHSLNVGLICNVFADWLKLNEEEKNLLTVCGLLHDLGKLLINREILNKPGRLTEEEYAIIKEHPKRGYDFLKDKDVDERVKKATLSHHERCDGSGYPFGLKTEEIEKFAAITAIADVFEAMTANRVYREGICPFTVIRIFDEEGHKDFNPVYLIPIMRKLADAYLQQEVILNDGTKGTVLLLNQKELSRPTILSEGKAIDLSVKRNLEIVKILI